MGLFDQKSSGALLALFVGNLRVFGLDSLSAQLWVIDCLSDLSLAGFASSDSATD